MMLDIWCYLGQFLEKDVDRFHLMITSKEMMELDLTFDEEHYFYQMFESSFYDNFTNIKADRVIHFVSKLKDWPLKLNKLDIHIGLLKINVKFPSTIKYLKIYENIEGTYMIPPSVTHLTLRNYLNKYENEYIPSSVTHLVLDNCDNKNMYHFKIPTSVNHLTLNPMTFTRYVVPFSNKFIPTSVTHLVFGKEFNREINNECIPSSVTHLTFGPKYNQNIDGCIPSSVIQIHFGSCYYKYIQFVPSTVRKIFFRGRYEKLRMMYIKGCLPNCEIIYGYDQYA